jgi:hypothetical protein
MGREVILGKTNVRLHVVMHVRAGITAFYYCPHEVKNYDKLLTFRTNLLPP